MRLPHRPLLQTALTTSSIALLAACATNQPFDAAQRAIIKQHTIVTEKLPADYAEPLPVYTKSAKTGTDIGVSIAASLLSGGISFGSHTPPNEPRKRFNDSNKSLGQAIKNKIRQSNAEKIQTAEPTRILHDLLAERYPESAMPTDNNMTISVKPVAWHLYYNDGDTYLLEYAGDITLNLPAQKLRRYLPCDRSSEQALTKEEWLANDALRIRSFAEETARRCTNVALLELGEAPLTAETATTLPATPATTP